MQVLLERTLTMTCTRERVYEDMMNPKKYTSFFDNTFLSITGNEPIPEHFQFVATISDTEKPSYIHGKINSVKKDESFHELDFEWNLNSVNANETEVTYRIYNKNAQNLMPIKIHRHNARTATIISSSIAGLASMGLVPGAITISAASASGVTLSQPLLAAIILSVAAITGGGILVANDVFLTDPYVDYVISPAHLPAELHGTELIIRGVYANEDMENITSYYCEENPIIRELEYSFDCVVINSLGIEQTVTTPVQIKAPTNHLNVEAIDCISRYTSLSDKVTDEYPYLLNLPTYSPSKLKTIKTDHIKIMDEHSEKREYEYAKKHAMIILKYFNNNDVQALSTLGNIIRDENRQNRDNVQCAKMIHSTPFIMNTAWGKLSLAEDNHVLDNFEQTSILATDVIQDYESGNPEIHPISYKNALIIKANALFRIAMVEQSDDLEYIRDLYSQAHNIEESYDSWFGLGNLDRYQGDFDSALRSYEEAKKLADDTTEIDYEISVLLSYVKYN